MSGTHKYPTISFRISPREREEIEAKIFTSGMKKKDYFVRSCIYNRVCVVGKKETVYQIVERLQEMENRLVELAEQIDGKNPGITSKEIRDLREAYEDMLKAILWIVYCVLPYSKQAVLQNPSSAAIKRLRAMLTRSRKEDHAERKIFNTGIWPTLSQRSSGNSSTPLFCKAYHRKEKETEAEIK